MLAYIGLFITSQVQIFILCNGVGSSDKCQTNTIVGGSIITIIDYIVIIATWIFLRRYYRQNTTNPASKYSEAAQPEP
jgi:hypothetical protein